MKAGRLLQRLSIASWFAALALSAAAGVAEAGAKGPDAEEVGIGTFLVVLAVMAFLSLVYAIRRAFGAGGMPPPDETSSPGHH